MEAGIDCVAVTDHNTGEWIDRLKETYETLKADQPQGFREIHLFPGVEISVSSGLHVLAVFDKDKNSRTITCLLGAVGFPENLAGETNIQNQAACTRESLVKVVEEIHRQGGIAIPASARNAMKMGIATTISAGPLAGRGLDSRYPFAPICHPSQLVYRRVIIGEHVGKAVRMSFQDDTHSSAIILMTALDIQAVIYTPIPGVDPDAA